MADFDATRAGMAHDGPDWLARARAELAELEGHIAKLDAFIFSQDFHRMVRIAVANGDPEDMEACRLMEHQLKAMTEYRRHLARRVWLGTRKLPQ